MTRAAILLLVLVSTAWSQQTTTIAVEPNSAIPQQATYHPVALLSHNATGVVTISTSQKHLAIQWSYDGDEGRVYSRQGVDLNFWPTAAAVVRDSLLVAGKRPSNGKTVIQAWTFTFPDLPDVAEPVIATEVLYNADAQGKRTVRFLQELHGSTAPKGAALVQFADSNDVYSFDIDAETLSIIYSAANQLSALSNPAWRLMWSAEHQSLGYVYIYSKDPGTYDDAEHLILFDGNKDGSIDSYQSLTVSSQWDTLFGTPPTWIQVFE